MKTLNTICGKPQEATLKAGAKTSRTRSLLALWGAYYLVAELAMAVVISAGVAIWGAIVWRMWEHRLPSLGRTIDNLWSIDYARGSLLGFTIATVTIVLGFLQTPRLRVVRESAHYPDLWKTFNSAIRVLALATASALAALITDKDAPAGHPNHIVFYICFFSSLLAVLRLARCIWLMHHVIWPSPELTDIREVGRGPREDVQHGNQGGTFEANLHARVQG